MQRLAAILLGVILTACTASPPEKTQGPVRAQMDDGVDALARGDNQAAFRFFERSAHAGNVEGQVWLARLYSRGQGVPQNYVEAALWNQRAAEQGSAEGQSQLGAAYSIGRGVPQSYDEAVKWLRLAAEQGDASAQFNLASMYAHGRGVPKDYVQALKWYSISATRHTNSTDRYIALSMVTDMASMMTSAQVREAHELAARWKPTQSGSSSLAVSPR